MSRVSRVSQYLKSAALLQCMAFLSVCSLFQHDAVANSNPVTGSSPPYIHDGYMDKMSYAPGEKARVYVNALTTVTTDIEIETINGNPVDLAHGSIFPQEPVNPQPWTNGFGYSVSFEYTIPELKSGMYFIENKIPFIIKSPEADIVLVYPSNTDNAYCSSGGESLYGSAQIVSFLRPIPLQRFAVELLKWIESETTFNIKYICDLDMESYGEIKEAKVVMVVGHSEYWTRTARENFDRFVDSGGNAIILSGNSMWWQVRYNADKTQLICYRSVTADPIKDPLLKTILWTSASLKYPIFNSIGADFDEGGYGQKTDQGWDGFKIVNPASPLLEGTGLHLDDILSCPTDEFDGAPLSGFDSQGYPIIDNSMLNFFRTELIGFDFGFRGGTTVGTLIAFQKAKDSGKVINTCSSDWGDANGIGGTSGDQIKLITTNMITKLLYDQDIFGPGVSTAE